MFSNVCNVNLDTPRLSLVNKSACYELYNFLLSWNIFDYKYKVSADLKTKIAAKTWTWPIKIPVEQDLNYLCAKIHNFREVHTSSHQVTWAPALRVYSLFQRFLVPKVRCSEIKVVCSKGWLFKTQGFSLFLNSGVYSAEVSLFRRFVDLKIRFIISRVRCSKNKVSLSRGFIVPKHGFFSPKLRGGLCIIFISFPICRTLFLHCLKQHIYSSLCVEINIYFTFLFTKFFISNYFKVNFVLQIMFFLTQNRSEICIWKYSSKPPGNWMVATY